MCRPSRPLSLNANVFGAYRPRHWLSQPFGLKTAKPNGRRVNQTPSRNQLNDLNTLMKQILTLAIIMLLAFISSLYADFGVTDTGTWPDSWPKDLEPLRKQSRTLEGPIHPLLHYAIPFTDRGEFESSWPHLLKIKSMGAPIVLRRGPIFWLSGKSTGVCIHTPPEGQAPVADGKDAKGNWEQTIYIELIVDGEIIDLNRIQLPPDTPIIDERFKELKGK
jgi:hypothetical protein